MEFTPLFDLTQKMASTWAVAISVNQYFCGET